MTRHIWFITRPERDPQFHAEAMKALSDATDNFSIKWKANREAHKNFEKTLAELGLKRNNISNDGSGGRTWAAMLKTFAYCYTDDNGYIVPTEVGKALIEGENEFQNIKKQILTLQIPNAYFLEPGFRPKFDEAFKIRPARFLIQLVQQESLEYYVTKEEITYFALTAKKDSDLAMITQDILDYRKSSDENKEEIKRSIAITKDHRERSDKVARDYWEAHSDVAHTFMMLCEYTELVEYERGYNARLHIPTDFLEASKEDIKKYNERYPFNIRYKLSLERMALTNGLDITRYKSSSYGTIKPVANKSKENAKIQKAIGDKLFSATPDEIKETLINQFGERTGLKHFNNLQLENIKWLNVPSEFVEVYLGEMTDKEFEIRTASILRQLGFDEVIYQPKIKGITTEIEILVRYGDKFGIIDTKYYRKKFSLSQNLASYMGNEYISNYANYNGWKLAFYGYVTAERFTGENKLLKITEMASKNNIEDIKGFLVTRKTLLAFLDYCLENELPPKERLRLFLNNIDNTGIQKFKV